MSMGIENKKDKKVRFKDLSWPLKVIIIFGWLLIAGWIGAVIEAIVYFA